MRLDCVPWEFTPASIHHQWLQGSIRSEINQRLPVPPLHIERFFSFPHNLRQRHAAGMIAHCLGPSPSRHNRCAVTDHHDARRDTVHMRARVAQSCGQAKVCIFSFPHRREADAVGPELIDYEPAHRASGFPDRQALPDQKWVDDFPSAAVGTFEIRG